jgi:PKD repeat protein
MARNAVRVALAALALVVAVSAQAAPTITKGPYLQNARADSIVAMWETSESATSRVEYGLATSYGQSLTSSTAVRIHEVRLTGLAADTAYHYRVVSTGATGTVFSSDSTLRTAIVGATPFRFVAYGDSRTFAASHAAVVSAIIARAPRLVLHTGDLVRDGTVASYWQTELFDPARPLLRTTPFYATLGNHEYHSSYYYAYFSTPPGGGTGGEQWYSFDYGNAHFISLDTSGDYSSGSAQYNWLVNDLRSTTAEWVVVFTHYPAYSSGVHGGTPTVQSRLVPLFEQYGVDMVFCGHDHIYERSYKNGIYYFVTGGGGAELYSWGKTSNPYRQFSKSAYHHITVDIDGNTATIKARTNDGVAFDTVTITHVSAPVADFSATPMSGVAPLTTYFSDRSENAPTSWSWSFGDSGTSNVQNPSHQYPTPGSYTVALTATNASGSDTETKVGYVSATGSCHVGSVTLTGAAPPRYRAVATITVHDQGCQPLSGVTVAIAWWGSINALATGTTDASGTVTLTSPRSRTAGSVTCCVTGLSKAEYPYQSGANHQTCGSLSLRVGPRRLIVP